MIRGILVRLDEIVGLIEPALFQVGKNQDHPVGPIFRNMGDDPGTARTLAGRRGVVARRQCPQGVMMTMQRDSDLLQVACALDAARRLASALHGRQENPDQYSDDGNDHQEFHERKTRRQRASAGRSFTVLPPRAAVQQEADDCNGERGQGARFRHGIDLQGR